MKEAPKFLSESQIKEKASEWSSATKRLESKGFSYTAGRADSTGRKFLDSISDYHGVSFIREVIPGLIEKKKPGEKVKILDIGAGANVFTEEIRREFGDKVKVYSTGLAKKSVKQYRENKKGENDFKMHPDDLKWRSILELSDYPEFDLIVDTWGEFYYMYDNSNGGVDKFHESVIRYLSIAIKKLKPGGILSISPIDLNIDSDLENSEVLKRLSMDENVKISFYRNESLKTLRIEKLS